MKRIVSFSNLTPIALFLIVWSAFMAICCILGEFNGDADSVGTRIFWFFLFTILTFFFIWSLNRFSCKVWIENGIVKSKGLICGFYKECPVSNIKTVIIRYSYKDGYYIYLVDESKYKYDHIRKASYIAFRRTTKNLEFLNTFWSSIFVSNSTFIP